MLTAVVLLPTIACRAAAVDYEAFRIMTFNICHCATHYSLSVTDEDVKRTASVIAAERPDFVCLQEVDKCTTRSAGIDEAARIAELLTEATGVRYYGTFGKGRDYQGGEFGVAILSRHEPVSVSTTALEGTEPRSLLVCEFADCCVATVHLDTDRDFRTNSIPQIRSAIAAYSKPVLITGDWNATPESDTTAQMKEFLTVISPESGIRTFGDVNGPDYVIDYIAVDTANADKFYVKRGFCVSNELNGEGTSDHNPVIVDLAVRPDEFKWVEENAVTTGRTGTWSTNVVYDAETLTAEIENTTFTPSATSRGRIATSTFTATFLETWGLPDPDSTAQAAIRLGTNGCFQVWTRLRQGYGGQAGNGWVDVVADGVTPTNGVEYTFLVTFDYKAQTYSVEVKSADEWQPLSTPNSSTPQLTTHDFPLATRGMSISRVKFTGETTFTSLLGECVNKLRGFVLRLF